MTWHIWTGDARDILKDIPDSSVQCCVTSPPYFGLRDYGHPFQIGLEATIHEYIGHLEDAFAEVWRVLRSDGTLWLNVGDSYSSGNSGQMASSHGSDIRNKVDTIQPSSKANPGRAPYPGIPPKNLLGIPWRLAFALQDAGWYLRQDIIWNKPNPMPESVTDRCTKSHEYVFLFTKKATYYYDAGAIAEPVAWPIERAGRKPGTEGKGVGNLGQPNFRSSASERQGESRNRRDVWTIATEPTPFAHFATMPTELVKPCILAGSREGDTVLDPFAGSGTVGVVALRHNRNFIGIELNPAYVTLAQERIVNDAPMFNMEMPA